MKLTYKILLVVFATCLLLGLAFIIWKLSNIEEALAERTATKILEVKEAPKIALELKNSPDYKIPPKPVEKRPTGLVGAGNSLPRANCEQYRLLLAQYDWDVNMVMKIATAESGCDPTNHNEGDKHKTCLGSWNLLNVGCVHYLKGEDINDLNLNIKKAYKVYQDADESFRKWTTCKGIPGCY